MNALHFLFDHPIQTFACIWCFLLAMPFLPTGRLSRTVFSWLLPFSCIIFSLVLSADLDAASKLFASTIVLLYSLKSCILLQRYSKSEMAKFDLLGLLVFMSVWPGMDPAPFERRPKVKGELDAQRFVRGYLFFSCGLLGSLTLAIFLPQLNHVIASWLALACIISSVHLGYADILTSLLQMAGWRVQPLFNSPWACSSLADFWSKRWNHAFVEMNKILFLPALKRVCGKGGALFAIFVLSGLLHAFAISFPVQSSCAGPITYFVIQGLAFFLERRLPPSQTIRRLFSWAVILLPLPLLAIEPFRLQLVLAPFESLHKLIGSHESVWYWDKMLWLAALGNFCTCLAGIQVPKVMNWKDELKKVSRFNRKIFLNYYGYVGLMIISWGVLSITLHNEMLAGEKSAISIAAVISIFWAARIAVDFLWFKHDDWPKGAQFVIGHVMLTSLFIFLTVTYTSLSFLRGLCF